jgi:phosphinothricin acetyltransferase
MGIELPPRLGSPEMAERPITIRPMDADDWASVRSIYEEGIATGDATFETAAPVWEAWDAGHLKSCRFVAIDQGVTVGWAALSGVSSRCVYTGVAEVSIYVAGVARGRGIGRRLLAELVEASEREGVWTLQAGVFPENVTSLAIHQRCGFRVVGRRARLGRLAERWRDVLLLERRSAKVGVEGAGSE